MSLIKKAVAFILLLAASGYAAQKWEQHAAFQATGERLVRQLGDKIVGGLGDVNQTCRGYVKVDSVTLQADWPLGQKGTAALYISGRNSSAISLGYAVEAAGENVYVKPIDSDSAKKQVVDFALNNCS